jgi:predicted transcriptional regulator
MNEQEKAQAIQEISELERERKAISHEIKRKEQALAEALAKFRVGQRVIVLRLRGLIEYEITKVELGFLNEVAYHGAKILKGGRVGAHSRRLWADEITAKTVGSCTTT